MERASLSETDKEAASQIIRALAEDVDALVRRALAVTLRSSLLIPRDVALSMARDVEAVATPILSFSPLLLDDDLVTLIEEGMSSRQVAIAKRTHLSANVTSAFARSGLEEAVKLVVSNDNAVFEDKSLSTIVDRFPGSNGVLSALVNRKILPVEIADRLVVLVGRQLRDDLLGKHHLSPEVEAEITSGSEERATVDLVDQIIEASDVAAMARHLHLQRRLSPSLMLRALARGQVAFFERGLSELAGVPFTRATMMIHDSGPVGFRALYERAGLPARLYPAFKAGLDTQQALIREGVGYDVNHFQAAMLERFLTQQPFLPREDMTYLLRYLDRLFVEGGVTRKMAA